MLARPLHDGAASGVLVALCVLDLESDAGGFGEGFIYAAVLHGRAFCKRMLALSRF